MFQNRYKHIRTTLNNKARDVITTMRFRWSQMFWGFKSINWRKELKIIIQNITKMRVRPTGQE
jgi:hypothetical protein